jgi:tetratricopeptide (TPR) repeat protein
MSVFTQRTEYDRFRILAEASHAESRGRRRKAVSLYRWMLAVEPHNTDVHMRLAPLLARTGHPFDAWTSFRAAARALVREGALERALALYEEATRELPRELDAWLERVALLRRQAREREALPVLREARHHFQRRSEWPKAIYLLRRARQIEPWDPEVVLDLARLLSRTGQIHEALLLLDRLAQRSGGRSFRRARGLRFLITLGIGDGWRWLRAALGGGPRPDARAA